MRQLEVEKNSADYCAELVRIFPMCPRITAFLLQLSQNPANTSFKSSCVQHMRYDHKKKSKNNEKSRRLAMIKWTN